MSNTHPDFSHDDHQICNNLWIVTSKQTPFLAVFRSTFSKTTQQLAYYARHNFASAPINPRYLECREKGGILRVANSLNRWKSGRNEISGVNRLLRKESEEFRKRIWDDLGYPTFETPSSPPFVVKVSMRKVCLGPLLSEDSLCRMKRW